MKKFLVSIFEVLEVALIAVVSVFLIRTFLIQPFLVSGASMSPNFSNGDYLLVDELTYRFRSPERGEVAVFKYKGDSTYFIKRIIGLPGEKIQIKTGGVVVFNNKDADGFILSEPYLIPGTITAGVDNLISLGKDEYFVLGDNRTASFDSRSWGMVKRKDVVGLARLRLWPLDSFRAFAAPSY